MRRCLFLIDLPKDGGLVIDYLIPSTQQTGREAPDLARKGQFRSRRTQTAILASSDAAKPRVPVPKARVVNCQLLQAAI
jgi:hypothetical protein